MVARIAWFRKLRHQEFVRCETSITRAGTLLATLSQDRIFYVFMNSGNQPFIIPNHVVSG